MLGGTVVGVSRQRTARYLLGSLVGLSLSLPIVLAATGYTGISPLNRVVELLSTMFTLPALKNANVQLGFIRFALFVLFLAVAHYAFKKVGFDNKTAGVIATVFALIAAFLMPENWVTANGGVITAVFAALIPLGVICYGVYFCVTTLNRNFIGRLIAIVILLLLLEIINVYKMALGLPVVLLIPPGLWQKLLRRGDR
jgi:hypothetical protein